MIPTIDNPATNDNRNYDYSQFPETRRAEYEVVLRLVQPGTRVIDLGCGNGTLLALLEQQKKVIGTGVELSASGVEACRKKGLNVIRGRIDQEMQFPDNSFDYAVCNVTVQMLMYPEILLREMRRIAKRQIVSFPNFANWKNRLDLLLHGRMPLPMLFGYAWYNTGHVHQLSVRDFYELLRYVGGLRVVSVESGSPASPIVSALMKLRPNLFQIVPVFLLETTM